MRGLMTRRRFQYAALALAIATGAAYVTDVSGLNPNTNDNSGQPLNAAKASSVSSSGNLSANASSNSQQGTDYAATTKTNVHASGAGTIHTNVTVNGDDVAVPSNGVTHKTIQSDNGNTSIDISNTSSGSNSSNTTLNVSVESESTGGLTNE